MHSQLLFAYCNNIGQSLLLSFKISLQGKYFLSLKIRVSLFFISFSFVCAWSAEVIIQFLSVLVYNRMMTYLVLLYIDDCICGMTLLKWNKNTTSTNYYNKNLGRNTHASLNDRTRLGFICMCSYFNYCPPIQSIW